MKNLIIINEHPYGSEKPYNALRLALKILKEHSNELIRIFLMADAPACALKNQVTSSGHHDIENMIKSVIIQGGEVRICASCAEERGLKNSEFVDGSHLSTMEELTNWFIESDKIINF